MWIRKKVIAIIPAGMPNFGFFIAINPPSKTDKGSIISLFKGNSIP